MKSKIPLKQLKFFYLKRKSSVSQISRMFHCSERKVNYWMKYHGIPKRTISEAIYLKHNPKGNPFKIKNKLNKSESLLKGLGLGLYWGEGDKSLNNSSVRLSNADPKLIKNFREFLVKICRVKRNKFLYSLILFNDAKEEAAIKFWIQKIKVKRNQLGKITKISPQGKGTYKKKSQFGVLTIYVNNKKLKDWILSAIKNFNLA